MFIVYVLNFVNKQFHVFIDQPYLEHLSKLHPIECYFPPTLIIFQTDNRWSVYNNCVSGGLCQFFGPVNGIKGIAPLHVSNGSNLSFEST